MEALHGLLVLAHFGTGLLVLAHWYFPFKDARRRKNLLTTDQIVVAYLGYALSGVLIYHSWFDHMCYVGVGFAAGKYWAVKHSRLR